MKRALLLVAVVVAYSVGYLNAWRRTPEPACNLEPLAEMLLRGGVKTVCNESGTQCVQLDTEVRE
jgi:hypothetical protein